MKGLLMFPAVVALTASSVAQTQTKETISDEAAQISQGVGNSGMNPGYCLPAVGSLSSVTRSGRSLLLGSGLHSFLE
jgi:hypothetical protein